MEALFNPLREKHIQHLRGYAPTWNEDVLRVKMIYERRSAPPKVCLG